MPRIKQYESQLGFDAGRVPSSGGVTAPISSAGQEWGALAHLGDVAGDVAIKVYERKLLHDEQDRKTAILMMQSDIEKQDLDHRIRINNPVASASEQLSAYEDYIKWWDSVPKVLDKKLFTKERYGNLSGKLNNVGITEQNQAYWDVTLTDIRNKSIASVTPTIQKARQEQQVGAMQSRVDILIQNGEPLPVIEANLITMTTELGWAEDKARAFVQTETSLIAERLGTEAAIKGNIPVMQEIVDGKWKKYFTDPSRYDDYVSLLNSAKKGLVDYTADTLANEAILRMGNDLYNAELKTKIINDVQKRKDIDDETKKVFETRFRVKVNRNQEDLKEQQDAEADKIYGLFNDNDAGNGIVYTQREIDATIRASKVLDERDKAQLLNASEHSFKVGGKSDNATLAQVSLSIQEDPSSYSNAEIRALVGKGLIRWQDAKKLIDEKAKREKAGGNPSLTSALKTLSTFHDTNNTFIEPKGANLTNEEIIENDRLWYEYQGQLRKAVDKGEDPYIALKRIVIDPMEQKKKQVAEKETGDILDRLWGWTKGVVGIDDDEVAPKEGSKKVEPRKPNETIQEYLKRTGK